MKSYRQNLLKTIELIDLCFTLKKAYMRSKLPEIVEEDLERRIWNDILRRKENKWRSAKASS